MSNQVKGFDVSHFQGLVDYAKAAKAGYQFVIAKSTEGGLHGSNIVDPYFVSNFNGATAAGLQFNAYHFFRGVSENDARDEADRMARTLKNVKFNGYAFCDTEYQGLTKNAANLTSYVNAFFEQMVLNGFSKLGIYCNLDFYKNRLVVKDLKPGILIWIADYTSSAPTGIKFDVWQHSQSAKVAGVSGADDEDYSYSDLIGKPKPVVTTPAKTTTKTPAPVATKPVPADADDSGTKSTSVTIEQVEQAINDALSKLKSSN